MHKTIKKLRKLHSKHRRTKSYNIFKKILQLPYVNDPSNLKYKTQDKRMFDNIKNIHN